MQTVALSVEQASSAVINVGVELPAPRMMVRVEHDNKVGWLRHLPCGVYLFTPDTDKLCTAALGKSWKMAGF